MTRRHAIGRPFGRFQAPGGSPERSLPAQLAALLGLAIGLVCSCGGPSFVAPERVVLLSIDTLRADHVGCYGASDAHTPNLDTIAAQGVRFEVALSPVPLTLPAHASLLTGLEPPAHGVRHNSIHRLGTGLQVHPCLNIPVADQFEQHFVVWAQRCRPLRGRGGVLDPGQAALFKLLRGDRGQLYF